MEDIHYEIEKKYIVEGSRLKDGVLAGKIRLDTLEKLSINQGYLCNNPTIRIRKSNEEYVLTYKSKSNIENKDSNVIVNREEEVPLTKESYNHLLEKIDYNIVKKDRYKLPLENELIAEIDVFKEQLEGLIMVEVEFPSEKEAMEFSPPDWFGKDVSSDKKYKNLFLAQLENYNSI